jgi:putative ABC transport system substrate-binding protein
MVNNLSRPGANLTGVTCQSPDLVAKQLQLLWELLPGLKRIAVLVNPSTPYVEPIVHELRRVGSAHGAQVTEIAVRNPRDFDKAMEQIRQSGARAVLLTPDSMLFANSPGGLQIADEVIQ